MAKVLGKKRVGLQLLILLSGVQTFAADDWCIQNRERLPCSGAAGKCTRNKDYSEGGFVADTAYVQQTRFWPKRNKAQIGKFAQVCDEARVYKGVSVLGNARVFGRAQLFDHVNVFGNAEVGGDSVIHGNVKIFDNASVTGSAHISGHAFIFGNARVFGSAQISDSVHIFGSAWVYGTAVVTGQHLIYQNVRVNGNTDPFQRRTLFSRAELVNGQQVEFSRANSYADLMTLNPSLDETDSEPESELLKRKEIALKKLESDKMKYDAHLLIRSELNPEVAPSEFRVSADRVLPEGQLVQSFDPEEDLECCPVCLDTLKNTKNLVFTRCKHFICKSCYEQFQGFATADQSCPVCRNPNYSRGALEIRYPE
jgi:carbonic anhydrase/acetyltransferase-like protein (isoleucine patch superfamily)